MGPGRSPQRLQDRREARRHASLLGPSPGEPPVRRICRYVPFPRVRERSLPAGDVIVALRVERWIEINEINRRVPDMLAEHVEIVSMIEGSLAGPAPHPRHGTARDPGWGNIAGVRY